MSDKVITQEKFSEVFEKGMRKMLDEWSIGFENYSIEGQNIQTIMIDVFEKLIEDMKFEHEMAVSNIDINKLGKHDRIKLIYNTDGLAIRNLKDTVKAEQGLAFKLNPMAVSKIRDIDPDIQILLINENHSYFQNFANRASKEAMNLAVKSYGFYIDLLPFAERTPERRIMAVTSRGCSIRHLTHPTREECFIAVKENPLAIAYIKDKTDLLQITALETVFKKEYGAGERDEVLQDVIAECDPKLTNKFMNEYQKTLLIHPDLSDTRFSR